MEDLWRGEEAQRSAFRRGAVTVLLFAAVFFAVRGCSAVDPGPGLEPVLRLAGQIPVVEFTAAENAEQFVRYWWKTPKISGLRSAVPDGIRLEGVVFRAGVVFISVSGALDPLRIARLRRFWQAQQQGCGLFRNAVLVLPDAVISPVRAGGRG